MWVSGPMPTPLLLAQREMVAHLPPLGPMQKLAQCWAGTQACLYPWGLSAPASFSGSQGGGRPSKHPCPPPNPPQDCPMMKTRDLGL